LDNRAANDRDDENVANNDDDDDFTTTTNARANLLTLMDTFIQQILNIRKTLLGVSISALILAPIAIGLSVYLIRHPSFFAILEIENEFGTVLSILLGSVITISCIWLYAGIRQYKKIGSWNSRYNAYLNEKSEINRKISSQFGLE
jgi:phosphatidylserine/phosphatidylglycerophosphate/cardiolipin synthase-like enzyme